MTESNTSETLYQCFLCGSIERSVGLPEGWSDTPEWGILCEVHSD